MSDLVRVDPAELATHARTVDEIAGRVAVAARRGRAARAGPTAYGRLCAMVPPGLGALQDALTARIVAAAEGLYDTVTGYGRLPGTIGPPTSVMRTGSFPPTRAGPWPFRPSIDQGTADEVRSTVLPADGETP